MIGCNSNGDYKKQPSDTMRTMLIYQFRNQMKYDVGMKITMDSLMPVKGDSLKNKWHRTTLFFIPYKDTARDDKGNPRKDSTGKFIPITYWFPCPKDKIYGDMNIDIDSLLKTVDTTGKK